MVRIHVGPMPRHTSVVYNILCRSISRDWLSEWLVQLRMRLCWLISSTKVVQLTQQICYCVLLAKWKLTVSICIALMGWHAAMQNTPSFDSLEYQGIMLD